MLNGVQLGDLRPDLLPSHRMTAEMILLRDQFQGIFHPEMEGKLTAHH